MTLTMQMTPQEIVYELDKHIVGQGRAKKAVAIALRNRWRRARFIGQLTGVMHQGCNRTAQSLAACSGGRAAASGDYA